VKVCLQAGDVVLVGMGEQKRVDEEASLRVAGEALAQLLTDVWRFIVRIVGSGANLDVDEQLTAALKFDQRHVAVVYFEMSGFCSHAALEICGSE